MDQHQANYEKVLRNFNDKRKRDADMYQVGRRGGDGFEFKRPANRDMRFDEFAAAGQRKSDFWTPEILKKLHYFNFQKANV